jgi:hypothetical protein
MAKPWVFIHGRAGDGVHSRARDWAHRRARDCAVTEPWCVILNRVGDVALGTLAQRDQVTYYQARGLSGHTSPCGECAYLVLDYFSFGPWHHVIKSPTVRLGD